MSTNENRASKGYWTAITTFDTWVEMREYYNGFFLDYLEKKGWWCHMGYCRSVNKMCFILSYKDDRFSWQTGKNVYEWSSKIT
jgi:hypothetical protein